MGIKQQIIGERPNDNVTYGPPALAGLPPVSGEWVPYGDRSGTARPEGVSDLVALGEAIAPGVVNYVVKSQLQKLGDKVH